MLTIKFAAHPDQFAAGKGEIFFRQLRQTAEGFDRAGGAFGNDEVTDPGVGEHIGKGEKVFRIVNSGADGF